MQGLSRAEAVGFDDLRSCGSAVEARKRGLLKTQGKSYVIQDGDVVAFLFNV